MMRGSLAVGIGALALGSVLVMGLQRANGRAAKPASQVQDAWFPYKSPAFDHFVAASYKSMKAGDPSAFYSWFDDHFKEQAGSPPEAFLAQRKQEIDGLSDPVAKADAQQKLGGDIHRLVKKTIPKFSLERGFEFVNTERLGERQCFLQSVLVCGLLQKAGVPSGVAMVYKNIQGQATNNGHAVAVARLSDGKDVIVDCSDPEPFVEQRGLFVRNGKSAYIYVEPEYDGTTGIITAYKSEGNAKVLSPRSVTTLDVPFIDSQFDYYRGERAEGGVFDVHPTTAGLQRSAMFLRKSIQENPANPLAVYMLGHAYRKLGKGDLATHQYQAARVLYAKDGWLPQGIIDALARR